MTQQHTPGPWAWFGDPSVRRPQYYLATVNGGRRIVMGFERAGFNGAQPTFNVRGIITPAADLCLFAVGQDGVVGYRDARENKSVYRYDITCFDHPDARLIAAAPELLDAVLELVASRSAELTPGEQEKQVNVAIDKANKILDNLRPKTSATQENDK
ncbi:MAG: hypothetical protein HQL90_04175 [Magnetococcales bacterium]|nr:hypothetical protein [Magnetococcales bacterium]